MKKSAYFILLFLCSYTTFAQNEPCKTMQRHYALMAQDPAYRLGFENAQKSVSQSEAKVASTIFRVPVVIHVLHLGTAVGAGANISNEQIYSAIESLNDAYRKKPGTVFFGNGADVQIEFCLAQKNPAGKPHSGINRVNASTFVSDYATNGITDNNEAALKALSKWDHTRYYNIWVVSEIDGNNGGSGVQGYAYFPGTGATYDGAVMLCNAFGFDPTGTKGYNLKNYTNFNVTAIHELGHAFNLYHTFQGDGTGSTCPTDADCGTNGDCISDTPPHERSNSDCIHGVNICTGTSRDLFIHNYMDYSADVCQNEFTAGQAVRIQASLTTGPRASLVTASNLTACGCDGSSAPISRFTTDILAPCEGTAVQFTDESIDFPVGWSWTFQGGIPATSTNQNPSIYFTGAGPYTVTLTTTSSGSETHTLTKQNTITPHLSTILPFSEGFEGTNFPPTGWSVISDDANSTNAFSWSSKSATGNGTSTKCAFMNCYLYSAAGGSGQKDDLITPVINLEGVTNPSLSFNVSYTQYSGQYDTLEASVSTDCGVTWTDVYVKSGSLLQTSSTKGSSAAPSLSAHWRNESISLNSFVGSHVQIRFRTINDYGANIFLDDVLLQGTGFDNPVAGFLADTLKPEAGQTVTFSNTSTGTISTYNWNFGTGASLPAGTSGEGPHFVTYSSTGLKTVVLTVINPENETDTKTIVSYINVMTTTTAIEEAFASPKPSLSPNPATRTVQIRNSSAGSKITFINQIGEQVRAEYLESDEKIIDLSTLAKGVYTVLIQTGETVYPVKLVVQP